MDALLNYTHRFATTVLPGPLTSRLSATIFTLRLALDWPIFPTATVRTTTLTTAGLPADIYTHIQTCTPDAHARTVLVIHGAAASGKDDPRIIRLARAIALANPNTLVIIPQVPSLASANLAAEPARTIRDVVAAVAADSSLCPSGVVSLASPCVSAGFCLIAAAATPHVHSILCIGTHASAENILRHSIARKGRGDCRYAVNLILASFWRPPDPNLRRLFVAYCADDHYGTLHSERSELKKLLPLDDRAAKLFERLHEDSDFLEETLWKIYRDNEEAFRGMSPLAMVDELRCRNIVLLHALKDEILPPNESVLLHAALQSRQDISSTLFVTSALNHGNRRDLNWRDVLEGMKLVDAFSVFFMPQEAVAP